MSTQKKTIMLDNIISFISITEIIYFSNSTQNVKLVY